MLQCLSLSIHYRSSHTSLLVDYSTIPSQYNARNSQLGVNLSILISGSAINTPDFPPKDDTFASTSPKALDTASRPGNIHLGPNTTSHFTLPSSYIVSSTP